METKKVWLLPHPLHQYKESQKDIKKMALINDLIIIDSKYASEVNKADVETNPPKLTKKRASTKSKDDSDKD
jgi:hypothetical protein